MKNILFIFLSFTLVNIHANEDLFYEANNLYTKGNYSAAIIKYNSILSNNIESYELYYNIGNCYYKIGDWANAIWHYEKSMKIQPNEKTRQNLALVNLKIIDKIEPLPELFYKKWLRNITLLLSLKSWQTITLTAIWFLLLFNIFTTLSNFKKNKPSYILLLISIICFFISNLSYNNIITKKQGVIFSSTVTVNSAPSEKSTDLFLLHSGVKVEIIDTLEDWIEIKITNGNRGWIKENTCKNL